MLFIILTLFLDLPFIKPANKAVICFVIESQVHFVPELSKSVDNDTRENIKKDHMHYDEESYIKKQSSPVVGLGGACVLIV